MAHDSYSSGQAQGTPMSFGALGEASTADLGPSLRSLTRLQCRLQADPLVSRPIFNKLSVTHRYGALFASCHHAIMHLHSAICSPTSC
eukprot:scaffold48892_cov17-Tisochrysis_lutea.AAC.5